MQNVRVRVLFQTSSTRRGSPTVGSSNGFLDGLIKVKRTVRDKAQGPEIAIKVRVFVAVFRQKRTSSRIELK